MRSLLAVLVSSLTGCAVLNPPARPPPMPAEEAFRPAASAQSVEGPRVGSSAWARQFRRAFDCELAARAERPGTEVAWRALQACVRRGDFTHLPELIGFWSEDLHARTDAPELLARVIAARGGSATEDLRLLRKNGIPVFDLQSAMLQPDAFRGQLVLFVAQVETAEAGDVVLVEQRRTAQISNVVSPAGSSIEQQSTGVRAGFQTTGFLGSGQVNAGVQKQTQQGRLEQRVDYGFTETGTMVLARLHQPDLSLTVAEPAVFLARFEGTRPPSETEFVVTDDEAGKSRQTPVVSLVAHHLVR
jgi:hypothetical protein